MSSLPNLPEITMDNSKSQPPQRVSEPAAPTTPEGTVPYTDPLPTADADAAAPDGAPRPTRPSRGDDHVVRPVDEVLGTNRHA